MKRITPEQVVEAYRRTSWRPVRREWAVVDPQGRNCGCGLAVVAGLDVYQLFEKMSELNTTYEDVVMERVLDLKSKYVAGFTAGFDGLMGNLWSENEDSRTGYEDGRAAWEAVKHLAE